MPLKAFTINTGVVGDTQVIPRVGFVIDSFSLTVVPAGLTLSFLLGSNEPVRIDGVGYCDNIRPIYDQDSRLGLIIRNAVAIAGTLEGFVSLERESDQTESPGVKRGS